MTIRNFFLVKIRLSTYFFVLFFIYLLVTLFVKGISFEAGALTLFSINSFLYGFYIAPVLGAQRTRIEEMSKTIRAEANALFSMMLETKELNEKEHDKLFEMFTDYVKAEVKQRRAAGGEEEYEALITHVVSHNGKDKDVYHHLLLSLVDNQKNRSSMSFLMGAKVYTNEWWIMLVLFTVTLGFVMFTDFGSMAIMAVVKALMCTGLTMLMINLLKLSTLTHKRTKAIWKPLENLVETRFYRID